jgi:hypothetical protein
VKFFEPDGGTATPEAQMWLGIALLLISAILFVRDLSKGPDLTIMFPLGSLLIGALSIRPAQQRKRK